MANSTNSQIATEAIVKYYKEKKIQTESSDWFLTKKYKNTENQTTRDFIYKGKINLYGMFCSIVYDEMDNVFSVFENTNFSITARNAKGWVVFNYNVIEKNKQHYFAFSRKKRYSKLDINDKDFLEERFKEIAPFFKYKETIDSSHIYQFPLKDIFLICEQLEHDRFSHNKSKTSIFNDSGYTLLNIDFSYLGYNPVSFHDIIPQKAEDKILFIVSNAKNKKISNQELGIIFKLMSFIPNSNLSIIFKMISGFDLQQPILDRMYSYRKNNTPHPFIIGIN